VFSANGKPKQRKPRPTYFRRMRRRPVVLVDGLLPEREAVERGRQGPALRLIDGKRGVRRYVGRSLWKREKNGKRENTATVTTPRRRAHLVFSRSSSSPPCVWSRSISGCPSPSSSSSSSSGRARPSGFARRRPVLKRTARAYEVHASYEYKPTTTTTTTKRVFTSFQTDESRADDHRNGQQRAQHGNGHFHVHVVERLGNLTLLDELRRRLFCKTRRRENRTKTNEIRKKINIFHFYVFSCSMTTYVEHFFFIRLYKHFNL